VNQDQTTRTEQYQRQADFLPEKLREIGITIIGTGSVGSFTTLGLAKMGFRHLKVFDADRVELHNISNQFFRLRDIGKEKVVALSEMIAEMEEIKIDAQKTMYGSQPVLPGIVISAVDSFEARRKIWASLKLKPAVDLYIDTRMGMLGSQVFTVHPRKPDEVEQYERSLVYQDQDDDDPCTARAILFTIFWIAAVAGRLVTAHVREEEVPRELFMDIGRMEITKVKEAT
jgi:sulfur carrier protein ThiS adenylyltransferase